MAFFLALFLKLKTRARRTREKAVGAGPPGSPFQTAGWSLALVLLPGQVPARLRGWPLSPPSCSERTRTTAASAALHAGAGGPCPRAGARSVAARPSCSRYRLPSSVPGPALGVQDTRAHAHYTLPRSCRLSQSPCPHRLGLPKTQTQ